MNIYRLLTSPPCLAPLGMVVGFSCPATAATISLHAATPVGSYFITPHGELADALPHYNLKATSDGGASYWTFCLESDVHFQNNRTYDVIVSDSTDSLSGRDSLSMATAYLYEHFALGQLDALLSDFTYHGSGGTRLQQMIWWLEDEPLGVQDPGMWNLVSGTLGDTALHHYTGSSVAVLNLTKHLGDGGDSMAGVFRQDQLIYFGNPPSRVPDGGATIGLFGAALSGLAIARRLQNKAKMITPA